MSEDQMVARVTARLDEAEQWALLAHGAGNDPAWRADHADVFARGGLRVATARSASVAPHIALNDPAHRVADIAAKRAILAEYERLRKSYAAYPNAVNAASFAAVQSVIRLLAEASRGEM